MSDIIFMREITWFHRRHASYSTVRSIERSWKKRLSITTLFASHNNSVTLHQTSPCCSDLSTRISTWDDPFPGPMTSSSEIGTFEVKNARQQLQQWVFNASSMLYSTIIMWSIPGVGFHLVCEGITGESTWGWEYKIMYGESSMTTVATIPFQYWQCRFALLYFLADKEIV